MSSKLNGFVEIPIAGSEMAYIRLSSIAAVFVGARHTLIQLHGCCDDLFNTSLSVEEVIALMAAVQNG